MFTPDSDSKLKIHRMRTVKVIILHYFQNLWLRLVKQYGGEQGGGAGAGAGVGAFENVVL